MTMMMARIIMSTTRGGHFSHLEEDLGADSRCDDVDDNDDDGLPSNNDDQLCQFLGEGIFHTWRETWRQRHPWNVISHNSYC